VARHHVTSVALIVAVNASAPGESADTLYVLGETAEGASDERRYRVQQSFRRRRLLPLVPGEGDDERQTVARTFRPLFVAGSVGALPVRGGARPMAVGIA
jgi:hypothetical protein